MEGENGGGKGREIGEGGKGEVEGEKGRGKWMGKRDGERVGR